MVSVKVTDKQIPIDRLLIKRLDKYIRRLTKKRPALDAGLLIDGEEGYGKTTFGLLIAYYVYYMTGRPLSVDNVFFDVDKMLDFAKKTKEQIIIWDEVAISGLAVDWRSKRQITLWKFLQVARKKRHFWIFCIPRFFYLKNFLIERTKGLVHVYAYRQEKVGNFVYFPTKAKIRLYDEFLKTKKKSYRPRGMRTYSFKSTFPDILNPKRPFNILDIFDYQEYDRRKDECIDGVGKDLIENKYALMLQYKIAKMDIAPANIIAKNLGIDSHTISNWRNLPQKYPFLLENRGLIGMKH